MKKIEEIEFKKLTLDMLVAFTKVCEEYNLRYLLDYGTLLGAIRHKGFIPWDDDIDVTMPRADYDKICEILSANQEILGDYYRASLYDNEYNTQKAYLNIVDLRTITISPSRKKKYYYPVWVDVFPMDIVPVDAGIADKLHQKCLKLLISAQKSYAPGTGKFKALKELSHRVEFLFLPYYLRKINKLAKSGNNYANNSELTNYMSPYGSHDVSMIEYYENFMLGEFENHRFRIPIKYDERLTHLYGDYMMIPSIDKRIPHIVDAYWIH